jgi:pseudouridine synthase
MRINQFIASASGLSRRASDTAIADGRASLNGQPATLGQTVETGDTVTLDGQILALRPAHTYILLNKPAGYVSSRVRQGSDPTLYDLLPAKFFSLRIAGRLDRDSSGLVVLSDDGQFIQDLTHPSNDKTKYYELTLSHPLTPADRTKLAGGVTLKDGPSHVTLVVEKGTKLGVTLSEGRNRQLRRTFGALGYRIEKLHRTRMGNFLLGELPEGKWTEVAKTGVPV